MPTLGKKLRVLIVDDNRDGADALGLVAEAFGNEVHVTYGGTQALDVATTFRPDLMLIDLAMPDMNGVMLIERFRQIPAFAQTRILAITGHTDQGHKNLALKAGFDAVLFKPVSLKEIEQALADVVSQSTSESPIRRIAQTQPRLSIGEARRRRNGRASKALTEAESQAALTEGIIRLQNEYMGWVSEEIHSYFLQDMLVIRIASVLTLAERQLAKSSSPAKGRDLIKQVRKQLLEIARPMLESLVHEITGVKALSMHHDISTVTGEEVVAFSLAKAPCFEESRQRVPLKKETPLLSHTP